jgi:hypothetical protein
MLGINQEGDPMTIVVKCKEDTDELEAGVPYEVLDERSWGYRLWTGAVAAWFRKDMFFKPQVLAA